MEIKATIEKGKSIEGKIDGISESYKKQIEENTKFRHPYYVTFTHAWDEEKGKDKYDEYGNPVITSDKTYEEVLEAFNTERRIIGIWNGPNEYMDVIYCSYYIEFSVVGSIVHTIIRLDDENRITLFENRLITEENISDTIKKDGTNLVTSGAIYDYIENKIVVPKSLSYFFANNYNNDLYGKVKTNSALIADYIFKNNSMTEIAIDLSSCYSLIGGFLNSDVETVVFENETPKLTKAQNLFRGCKNLKNVTGLILENVDSCKYMFYGCENIGIVTSWLKLNGDCSYMFYGCSALSSVELDCSELTNGTGIFTGCTSLTDIILHGTPDFTTIFNSLQETTTGIITLDDAAAVPDEVKTIATAKGWTIK